jgi:hypothetical protein
MHIYNITFLDSIHTGKLELVHSIVMLTTIILVCQGGCIGQEWEEMGRWTDQRACECEFIK